MAGDTCMGWAWQGIWGGRGRYILRWTIGSSFVIFHIHFIITIHPTSTSPGDDSPVKHIYTQTQSVGVALWWAWHCAHLLLLGDSTWRWPSLLSHYTMCTPHTPPPHCCCSLPPPALSSDTRSRGSLPRPHHTGEGSYTRGRSSRSHWRHKGWSWVWWYFG